MSSLRLAVVGGGHLGRIHARLAGSNDQFSVVGVADPSPTARRLISEQLNVPTSADYRELVDSIDAAVVAAPTKSHYEIASTLLRAGIHCLVEKPLAATPDEAQRLVQIAKSHAKVLQVGHVERFNPTWTTAQSHLSAPKFIDATRAGAYSGRSTDIGVVMDLMIHDLDLILSLDRSPVTSVKASGLAVLGSHEDLAEARIEFASGCIANLRASRLSTGATRRMQIYTANGFADIDFSSDQVQIIEPSAEVHTRTVQLDSLAADVRMALKDHIFDRFLRPQTLVAPKRNAILDEQNDFALSIQSGASPSVTGEDGARAVQVAAEIIQQIAVHRWDGERSHPSRVGALAASEPKILSLPTGGPEMQPAARKAG